MDAQSARSAQSALSGSTLTPSNFSGSSRTVSSWSRVTEEEERDYTQDNSLSPIDLEALIQTERITKILDECVYKTRLAICLPELVKEFNTLSSILSSENMDDLVFIFEQYDNPLVSSSLLNMDAMEEIKAGEVTLKNRLNPELGHLMYIMNSYPALKPKVEEMIEEMKLQYQGKLPPALDYLVVLEWFRDLMVQQLSTSAAEELAAKFTTRRLEAHNAKLIDKIKEITETLTRENSVFEAKMAVKREKIESLESELSVLQVDAATKLKEKILDSERQMVLAGRAHAAKNDILQEEQAEIKRTHDNMLALNVKNEKKLRTRRFRVELQLQSWISKYDVEMMDKQAELDDFQQKYEEEIEKCKKLEEMIGAQNIEYIPLMAEREAEYQKEMMEKMEKFRMEHAARVLQGAWRRVLANRAEKKKLRKIQKRMIAEAEAVLKKQKAKKKGKK
ncbi:dynein regulatory complex protein 10-like [Choristoneura fumiferana]|uniref:dynein regulatory complex protein 10-like n=1 Tax=Choristoneura fumiferana TaxID=7141 RepID=UPI003D15A9C7